jgi:alkylation response protein AidB-like acyl-CoA dehydrogenase
MSTLTGPADGLRAAEGLAPVLAARAAEHDTAGRFPVNDFDDLRAAGLMGLMVPTRLGGPGAGFADYAAVAMALAAGNGATALVYNMHCSVTGALASTPDEVARAMGVPESYFDMRDRVLRDAAAVDHVVARLQCREPRAGTALGHGHGVELPCGCVA